jgi:stage V sporulation protein S
MEKIELKVSSKTNPNSLAGAIAEFLKEGKIINIKTIGAGALNQAMKGITIAKGFVVIQGIEISCVPSFYSTEIDGQEISAIMILVERK